MLGSYTWEACSLQKENGGTMHLRKRGVGGFEGVGGVKGRETEVGMCYIGED